MEELKPCPFCKCDAGDMCVGVVKEKGHYAVVCNSMVGGCGATAGFRETPELAIKAWNTRAERTCRRVLMDCAGQKPYNQTGLNLNDTCNGCSECGFPWRTYGFKHPPYCPNCGAKVVSEKVVSE